MTLREQADDAKTWAADYLETVGVCEMLPEGCTDVVLAVREACRIQVRASRHRGDGCLHVHDAAGRWSGYYKPNENGRLILSAFGFGNSPGSIAMTLDGHRILSHFAADLAITNPNDAE